MAIENVQQSTAAQSGKAGYCVYFPVQRVVSAITVADATGEAALQTTLPAGTTLFMNVTAITLTSGVGVGYSEGATT